MPTGRRLSWVVEAVGATALIVLLARPLIFGGSDRGVDFYTHYWYVLHQGEALRDGGPSLWLHNDSGLFSAFYAFYGGTLYVLTGALALIGGSTRHAYIFSFLLASAASYGGWWWLARQAGLRGLAAHAPGLVFVTTAYAMTLLYVRGDWPEHVAVAMLPLLAASGLSVLRADRLRAGPALALGGSALVFTGSHNLTLLCGSVVLLLTGAALLLAVPEARAMVTRAGVLRVLAIAVPAVLVNAWFLIPDLVYGPDTSIAHLRWQWEKFLHDTRPNVDLKHLLTLSRGTVEPKVPHEAFALPVLAMGWTLVVVALARPRLRDPWLRALGALVVVGAIVLLAMTQVGVLHGPFVMMQFSYRLESYINLMVSGGVLAGLVLLKGASVPARARAGLGAALAIIAVVSVAGAVWQSDVHRDPATYEEWKGFPAYYTGDELSIGIWDYAQANEPYLEDPAKLPYMAFDPEAAGHGRVTARAPAPPGSSVVTNVAGLWKLLDLSGGRFVGISTGGRAIVQVEAPTLTVAAKRPPAFVIGRWLSFLGLAGLAANAVAFAVRARRRRRGPGDAESVETAPVGEATAV
ncbi:hypothetical protein [Baekduia sp. Peel2402]|uniref:hypothetical protein n=1 Tax=Baekduia sp. Peel2402 TaxID=3458296 RepID=UPI00403EE465